MRTSRTLPVLTALAIVAAVQAPAIASAADRQVKRPATGIKMRLPNVPKPKRLKSSSARRSPSTATNPEWVVTSPEGKESRIWGD